MVSLRQMLTHSAYLARPLCLALVGALLLAGCGSSARGGAPGGAATGGVSGQSHEPRLFNARSSGSGGGLLVVTEGARCGSYLVVKNPAGSYDSAAIRQMAKYVYPRIKDVWNARLITYPTPDYLPQDVGVVRGGQQYFNVMQFQEEPGTDKTIPDSLQWVAGGPNCFAKLEITNTGSSALQITSIGATLISDAVRNTYTYNLLNICSVQNDHQCHFVGTGSGSPTCTYYAEIALKGGAAGAHVEAPLNGTASEVSGVCALPLTIHPRDVATAFAIFSSPPWLYRTKLTFGVRSSTGTNRLTFSSLQQNLAFIDDSTPFNCLGLNGSTFAREAPRKLSDSEYGFHTCM